VVPLPGDPAARRRVLSLRLGGADYEAIAKAVPEVENAGHAARECEQALVAAEQLTGWEAGRRAGLEKAKLDLIERNVMAVMQNAVAAGADPATVLGAVDRLLRISEQRRALDTGMSQASEPDDPLQQVQRAIRLKLVTPG
jgi:hypothetical protein